ncbi:hypothetical protein COCC4DRAFT_141879 [Bipolaris maydis ATCC 48331]|uniref:Uncharacterized protein n=2 Tax=Cochliobolus heterostrophus TaxID=5016 RepID=M2UEK9_COCH5|nr:uncharacterized protein COCC4DRAFT_141879 [Bipolaris maydis ATCC 48331]EMD96979.1 hypothetical protein COCHEDRAFT_1208857 [Bipolaris maydis C5]KAH7558071.1 hypothetical protein BM1_05343 [Bipolaris maydis]ENI03850.1 hypothetical protein COCC4DRAFT_141879 [Bipolaris maydis ATCC 48331]KAJ5031162.1 hypothetical protein J3E73DRAFT_364225 [Bipolaris maydis]KAJ5052852.1 hypothetical protein J3E74DRAFT_411859 [Bipolaris maydis]
MPPLVQPASSPPAARQQPASSPPAARQQPPASSPRRSAASSSQQQPAAGTTQRPPWDSANAMPAAVMAWPGLLVLPRGTDARSTSAPSPCARSHAHGGALAAPPPRPTKANWAASHARRPCRQRGEAGAEAEAEAEAEAAALPHTA